jgi:hypothetical protein
MELLHYDPSADTISTGQFYVVTKTGDFRKIFYPEADMQEFSGKYQVGVIQK